MGLRHHPPPTQELEDCRAEAQLAKVRLFFEGGRGVCDLRLSPNLFVNHHWVNFEGVSLMDPLVQWTSSTPRFVWLPKSQIKSQIIQAKWVAVDPSCCMQSERTTCQVACGEGALSPMSNLTRESQFSWPSPPKKVTLANQRPRNPTSPANGNQLLRSPKSKVVRRGSPLLCQSEPIRRRPQPRVCRPISARFSRRPRFCRRKLELSLAA